METTINRIKTQIDFTTLRGNNRAQLVYTALNYYNRGSNTGTTASDLIIEAYKLYDPSETEEITEMRDLKNKAQAFISRYNIKEPAEILMAAKTQEVKGVTKLDDIKKKFFNFDADDPVAKDMWEILEGIRFRDRAAVLFRMLFQYFAHGNCPFYNDLCADRILAWMRDDYDLVGKYGTERIENIAEIIWRIGATREALLERENQQSLPDDGDRLRKAMGLI